MADNAGASYREVFNSFLALQLNTKGFEYAEDFVCLEKIICRESTMVIFFSAYLP
jgi:hypothetical protein